MSSLPKVFIPHVAERFNPKSQRKEPAFDFSQAARFGQIVEIMERNDDPLFFARHVTSIKNVLSSFNEGDYLLAVGDPSIIVLCSAIIARQNDCIRLLKWDKKTATYIRMEIEL